MKQLCENTKAKLDPKVPPPGQILLDRAAADATDNSSQARPERSPQNSILLFFGLKHVSYHAERDGTACRGETTEDSASEYGLEGWCEGADEDGDIDAA